MRSEEYGEYSVDDEDQLQPSDTLEDRGVEDALDEGYVTREGWSAGQGYGNTADEEARGESLDQRIAQEEPDFDYDKDSWSEDESGDQVGTERSGRLTISGNGDDDADNPENANDPQSDVFAEDVGIAGSAATAEEAAMHVIDDERE
ncbi:hypothetical protein EK0264_08770 [Epidermidibacterium keratini]|uniref:DUF5709 domain-containing protein n=1 Tax=Epidermidibacterium keratini TaxID=1891644 RepID=A0A7L4YMT0_9ACTN|nr:DUF5709 domain-containing protein [Epidermidibacterium keratini]QHC00362.1 hypothetical protein EK0264_08770 [Epidermidibacterium keratini]